MLYAEIHDWLGWPGPNEAFHPSGAGAQVYAEFARKKIQGAMRVAHPGIEVNVGIIAADPRSDSTDTPLAVVCEFPRAASDEVLDLAHKLAWNFSRTALLVTLEPHQIIAWSCYQDPTKGNQRRLCELPTPDGLPMVDAQRQRQLRDLLHWINLITHRAQSIQPEKFRGDGRADALLLKNLRYVRCELLKRGLAQEHCHDLLARVIFAQFLFHRKDSAGHAFFSKQMMLRLHEDGVLSRLHEDLASVLSHKTDTYALFLWMDERFNGDLFPGKDDEDDKERESAWRSERNAVSKEHLNLLAGLIRGDLDVADKQHTLWPYYSFDTIPLEFISSVYEEFLTADERGNDKAYYTPAHLVDYVLDAVLPWNSDEWNVRILDPCCGSAIFLVKAFQRLIHRWRRAHPGKDPLVTDLRPILENNLVGVDKNREAVRVACFSLYLAMADAIEPKHYVTRDNVKVFPRLRGIRLIHQDFFDEETVEIRTTADKESFDYVLGNAPWGDGSILPDRKPRESNADYRKRIASLPPTPGQKWAKANAWPVANKDIGPLFLAKTASLVKRSGFVALVNNASLLYSRDGQATDLRKRVFTNFTFDEVTNLSALRRELFSQAIGPACIVVFRPTLPKPNTTFHYFTPKPARFHHRSRGGPPAVHGFLIEPNDISQITHEKAAEDAAVWPTLAMGAQRDAALIDKLRRFPNLAKAHVITRSGVIPGDRKKALPNEFKERRYFDHRQFPKGTFLEMAATVAPLWADPKIDGRGSTSFEAFKNPQLLIKQSFSVKEGRFRAAIVRSKDPEWGVICKETYFTVRDLDPKSANIRAACIVYNSKLATYFLGLTSSRISHYITETLTEELVTVPLPVSELPDFSSLRSFEAIDEATREMFELTAADWNLIDDFLTYALPDALRKTPGPARFPTQRKNKEIHEPELEQYAKTFARVVRGTFGKTMAVASTIYNEQDGKKLPVRMLTIHLDSSHREGVKVERMEADGLLDELAKFHAEQLKQKTRDSNGSGLGFQRVAYLFQPVRENRKRAMNLTIVKPDECRYWTRSMAMRDADELAAAIRRAAPSRKTFA